MITVPVVLALWLVVGAILLALGRSWLAVFLPVAGLGVVLTWLVLTGDLIGGTGGIALLVWLLPAVTAALAVLPAVRGWVAARRLYRRTGR